MKGEEGRGEERRESMGMFDKGVTRTRGWGRSRVIIARNYFNRGWCRRLLIKTSRLLKRRKMGWPVKDGVKKNISMPGREHSAYARSSRGGGFSPVQGDAEDGEAGRRGARVRKGGGQRERRERRWRWGERKREGNRERERERGKKSDGGFGLDYGAVFF